MQVTTKEDFCVVSTNVEDINSRELNQMHDLKLRIKDVIDSHRSESKEKKYIGDDDLKLMYAILHVFTQKYSNHQTSAFDDALNELEMWKF